MTVTSLLEKLRTSPTTTHRCRFIGIDPDLHNTGWASILAEWTVPRTAKTVYADLQGGLLPVPSALRGLQAALASVRALVEHGTPQWLVSFQTVMVVEGQQVYPDGDAPRSEIIGKANDLLMLAQVTGGAMAFGVTRGFQVQAVLPRTWKGQKDKSAHQGHILAQLFGLGLGDARLDGHLVTRLPPKYNHAMDAVGIALWAAEQASMGLLPIRAEQHG